MRWCLRLRKRWTLDRDLEEEIAFHRAMRSGDSEAPRFGNPTLVKQTMREMWTFGWMEVLFQDGRYALRGQWRNKGFTVAALLLLALAIGANTAMFTVVKCVLLDPLPYPGSDRLGSDLAFPETAGFGFCSDSAGLPGLGCASQELRRPSRICRTRDDDHG